MLVTSPPKQNSPDRYAHDERLHPGIVVTEHSPYGKPAQRVELDRR